MTFPYLLFNIKLSKWRNTKSNNNENPTTETMDWDYSTIRGQHKWGEHCEIGTAQSPIDIVHNNTSFDDTLQVNPLKFVGGPVSMKALNKGVNISLSPIDSSMQVSQGPLEHVYKFVECHFHWGRDAKPGSEHTIDGKRTQAELHLVHQRLNESEPLKCSNGLSVLGIRLVVSETEATHPVLAAVLNLFSKVPYKQEEYKNIDKLDLYSLLESIQSKYYTYNGSLTTPPLSECVKWIVFSEPLYVSENDFNVFESVFAVKRDEKLDGYYDPFSRSGNCSCNTPPKIGDNFREVCDLNDRKIRRSFK